jgi:hypothetical protein
LQIFRWEAVFQLTLWHVHSNTIELKAILKVNAQAGQSGAVNKTSLESTAQDDDLQEVKIYKRPISNDTSESAKKSTKSVPVSTPVEQIPKAVQTRNFFAPLKTNDMYMETKVAESTLLEQEALRKSGSPPPIVMTSTTNLIQLQSNLKEHVKGEYEFRNTQNGTCIIAKEMADYSALKSYLENNSLQRFTFSPNSEKPIKAVICCLSPDMPVEDISNSLEDLGFNVISVRQLTTNRRAPKPSHYFLLP